MFIVCLNGFITTELTIIMVTGLYIFNGGVPHYYVIMLLFLIND